MALGKYPVIKKNRGRSPVFTIHGASLAGWVSFLLKLKELKMKKQNDLAKRKLKILIVDDLEFPRMVIRNMFHDLGYESHNNILEAANGLEALAVLEETPIDLIVCDWLMPIMTGFELLQKIRATPEFAKIPFIMLTAEAEKGNILRLMGSNLYPWGEPLDAGLRGIRGHLT